MDNVRYNISPCMASEAKSFVEKLDGSLYSTRNIIMADDKSHYDRYSFLRGDSKVAVVYDTSAQVISITASQEYADELLDLFKPTGMQQVKRSTVPAQGSQRAVVKNQKPVYDASESGDCRAKVFVTPKKNASINYGATVIATSKGAEIYTDEIFPPQRSKKMSGGDNKMSYSRIVDNCNGAMQDRRRSVEPTLTSISGRKPDGGAKKSDSSGISISGLNITATGAGKSASRKPTISFGDDEEYKTKQYGAVPKSNSNAFVGLSTPTSAAQSQQPKRRGRPPKAEKAVATADVYAPEFKTATVKGFSQNALTSLLNELKHCGAKIAVESIAGELNYNISSGNSKAQVKCFADAVTVQGKPSELLDKITATVNKLVGAPSESDPVRSGVGGAKVGGNAQSVTDKALKHRIPTAYGFLSEQSKTDFSYGLHDFSKRNLQLSDYSVLLVPPFRGLERFVFDLQRAEGITVKMIGQAFDKDDRGNYILKNGYTQRIGSVIYAEVLVALYTEYFSQRNFFAHSDNTADNVSRSLSDRNTAKAIFDRLLSVVEYNAKKLKEIGFDITPKI